ncbi:MAG: methyltransferase domain-containing protein, partial [Clostridia bacterium]|nr:methyltransferase domain-containing protein [Clostridia bacterium]
GIPAHAAINETVTLVKTSPFRSLGGFVNGVLRSVQRGGNTLVGLETLPPAAALSVEYSVPEHLVSHYITHYGIEVTASVLSNFVGGRPLYLRVNTLKTTPADLVNALQAEGIIAALAQPFENTLEIQSGGNPFKTKAYEQGLFHAQDPASGYCCQALNVKPGMRVLDVCAAPGGKSFTLAQMMENKGELIACDLYDHKIGLMEKGATRLGVSCMHSTLRDANSEEDIGKFDRILCDLPCSGLGVLGRKPEIRYKIVTFLDNFPAMQYGMLCNSVKFLKPGGVLVFSTCTLNPKENEENLSRLLLEHPGLMPYPILPHLERTLGEQAHYINLLPHVHRTDGFFIGAVRKVEQGAGY